MSFVLDQVHRIDAQLNRLQFAPTLSSRISTGFSTAEEPSRHYDSQDASQLPLQSKAPSARALALQAAIRSLSPGTSRGRALVGDSHIKAALATLSHRPEAASIARSIQDGSEREAQQAGQEVGAEDSTAEGEADGSEIELEWLLLSKATTQVYGTVLTKILDQAVDIANDIWYWNSVLSSPSGTLLYSVQSSPLRLWHWSSIIWTDVRARAGNFELSSTKQDKGALSQQWNQFYGLVKDVIKERSFADFNKQILSPITRIRAEIRMKQLALKRIRVRNANALGLLLGEGLANECVHGEGIASPVPANVEDVQSKWKASVSRNVALMEAVLAKTTDLETPIDRFDGAIAELTDDDPLYTLDSHSTSSVSPQDVAGRLSRLLALGLPNYVVTTRSLVKQHGRPSRLIRYWLPITIGILSSSTLLRILLNRQAQLVQWVQDLGTTVVDFWTNWVVEPTKNLIKTIRHDEDSAISLLSKRSLEGDRESLERMVVDFAIDNPSSATGSNAKLTDTEIADIRAKIREGDLTPVLRVYERDLASPVLGALRGNLIRALLIQIQKTKVDVDVAMGGIDSLLKSQELLIGFISLTPGLLVAWGLTRYLRTSVLAGRRNSAALRRQGLMLRQLRNIDRILTAAQPTEFGELLYQDQGLLICEVHVLRQAAARVMPTEILNEFGEEAEELCDVRVGIERQRRIEARIRWAYGPWLN